MNLTIKDDLFRFGVRTSCLIFNKEKTKILIQLLNNKIYMFQGGRITALEDSYDAIQREVKEELGISCEPKLRYTAESFIVLPNKKKYHEIGFYYVLELDKNLNTNEFHSLDKLDGNVVFKWIDIDKIDEYSLMPKIIVEKIKNKDVFKSDINHLIYREF